MHRFANRRAADEESLLIQLEAANFAVVDINQSVAMVAEANGRSERELISLLFTKGQ